MTVRRSLSAAVLVGALVWVSGCAASGPLAESTTTPMPSNPYEDQRKAGVEQLLADWADAVSSNDDAALEALVDPAASPEFLQSLIRTASNLSDVPLSEWGYEIVDEPETPVPSEIAERVGAADVWAPSVILRYGIDGPDDLPTRRPISLLVAERDDRWRLVSDTDLPGIDRRTWRGPWDFGPVTVTPITTAGGTSMVLGQQEQDLLTSRLATDLPAAVEAVADFVGDDWPRKTLIVTTSSTDEFLASAGGVAGPDVAAVSVSDFVVPGDPVTGQRVVFSPSAAERLTDFTTRSVLRHELTHIAARANTVDGSPTWMLEGFADYSGYRGSGVDFATLAPTLSRAVGAGGPPTVLPADSDFSAGGLRSTLAYESAWSLAAFVAERDGEPVLRDLYAQLATGPQTDAEISAGLEATVGSRTDTFIADWGAWVAKNAS